MYTEIEKVLISLYRDAWKYMVDCDQFYDPRGPFSGYASWDTAYERRCQIENILKHINFTKLVEEWELEEGIGWDDLLPAGTKVETIEELNIIIADPKTNGFRKFSPPLGTKGAIMEVSENEDEETPYRVQFWYNGESITVWVGKDDIEEDEDERE